MSVGLVPCVSTHSPFFDAWIVNNSIFRSINVGSDGGYKALRASALSTFVNMVHDTWRMGLNARKMHLEAAFYAIYVSVQPLRLAFDILHFSTMSWLMSDDFTT
jgi:hypothetical protein